MLTDAEERYLLTIPEDKNLSIIPYDDKLAIIAKSLISKVKDKVPEIEVLFIGASRLGISGQGDIDLDALSSVDNFKRYLPTLKQIFGDPIHEHHDSVE